MTKIQAVLNLTPDSFSDGGKYPSIDQIKYHIEDLIEDGVDIIDIGAESTRPNARTLSLEEEWERLEPTLSLIKNYNNNTKFSLDSRNPETQQKALDYGIDIINDVTGFKSQEMISAGIRSEKIIFMHSLTVPADKNIVISENEDVIKLLKNWAHEKIYQLEKSGIDKSKMIFDPGIGFGKNSAQSWNIIKHIDEFKSLDIEILVGHSEKSFLSLFTDLEAGERNIETLAVSAMLTLKNIDYIRVHDVKSHRRLLNVLKP